MQKLAFTSLVAFCTILIPSSRYKLPSASPSLSSAMIKLQGFSLDVLVVLPAFWIGRIYPPLMKIGWCNSGASSVLFSPGAALTSSSVYQSYYLVPSATPGKTPRTVVASGASTGVTSRAGPDMNWLSMPASSGSLGNSHARARRTVSPALWALWKSV